MRTNGASLPFKQAAGSAHRAVVDIKAHFEGLHALRNWIECGLQWQTNNECGSYAENFEMAIRAIEEFIAGHSRATVDPTP